MGSGGGHHPLPVPAAPLSRATGPQNHIPASAELHRESHVPLSEPELRKVKFGAKKKVKFGELPRAGRCPRAPRPRASFPWPHLRANPKPRKTTASSGPCPKSSRAGKKTPESPRRSCSIPSSEPKPRALSFRSQQSSFVRGLPSPPRAQGTLPDPPLRQDNLSPMFSSSWRGLAAAHGSPAPLPAPAAKKERGEGCRKNA